MNLTQNQIIEAVAILIGADGEDVEQVVRELSMENQILRQLFLSASDHDVNNLIEERESLVGETSFWDNVRNTEWQVMERCRKVWDDLHNNDTLTFNNFEDYYKHINKSK